MAAGEFVIAIACVVVLAIAAAFHFYWGLGGKIGLVVSLPQREGGQPTIKPGTFATHTVGFALVVAILIVLAYVGLMASPLPFGWLRGGVALLAFVFTARALSWHKYAGLFKKVRNTRFGKYDTWLYSPLCLFLGVASFFLLIKGTN
ncbi:MAG: DUF3995 domain-containing protein [Gammaproteobacteria bacterium]|nr:DUF3995 domain-containing protein [Gammaproteobacteria bacterium]